MSNIFILATTERLFDLLSTGQRAHCKSKDLEVFIHKSPTLVSSDAPNYHKRIIEQRTHEYYQRRDIISLELPSRMQTHLIIKGTTDLDVLSVYAPVMVSRYKAANLKKIQYPRVVDNEFASFNWPDRKTIKIVEDYGMSLSADSAAKRFTFVTTTDIELTLQTIVTFGLTRSEALISRVRAFVQRINKYFPPMATVTIGITSEGGLYVIDAQHTRIKDVCEDIIEQVEQNFLDFVVAGIDHR